MPKFIVKLPGGGETAFAAESRDIFIGRVQGINDICINDPSISRQHAHIKKREEGYTVYDLRSLNGITLNGKKISRALLKDGDELKLGSVQIAFKLTEESTNEKLIEIEQSEKTEGEIRDDPENHEMTSPAITGPKMKP